MTRYALAIRAADVAWGRLADGGPPRRERRRTLILD